MKFLNIFILFMLCFSVFSWPEPLVEDGVYVLDTPPNRFIPKFMTVIAVNDLAIVQIYSFDSAHFTSPDIFRRDPESQRYINSTGDIDLRWGDTGQYIIYYVDYAPEHNLYRPATSEDIERLIEYNLSIPEIFIE